MMFYHLFVYRESLTVFILILARPSIKSLIHFYWISSIVLDCLLYVKWVHSSSRCSFLHILEKLSSPYPVTSEVPQGLPWRLSYSVFLLKIFVLKLVIPNFSFSDMKIYLDITSVEDCKISSS
jgi:hypothetical protein